MVSDDLAQSAPRVEGVEYPVELLPCGPHDLEPELVEILRVAVYHEREALLQVMLFKRRFHENAVRLQVVPGSPVAHVEVAEE